MSGVASAGRRRSRRRGPVIFGVVALVFVVGLGAYAVFGTEDFDALGCPTDRLPREVVILVDASDPLTDKHRAEVERILQEMLYPATSTRHDGLGVQQGDRVSLYVLEQRATIREPDAQACHPGNPADWTFLDNLVRGKMIAGWRWNEFEGELFGVVGRLFADEENTGREESPIIETIGILAARHAASRRSGTSLESTHFVIVSDLLQHTDRVSQYRSYPPPGELPRELGADLSRVEVSLFRLEREKYETFQTPKHFYWWTDWVEEMGGTVVWQQPL